MLGTLARELRAGLGQRPGRFVAVGAVAAGLQMVLLWGFVDIGGLEYLVGAAVAIELTIIFQYGLNNAWTFQAQQRTTPRRYVVGLLKTNVVRGTAMPIQLAMLFVLVEWNVLPYLSANAVAISITGVYRYVLDARWTWSGPK